MLILLLALALGHAFPASEAAKGQFCGINRWAIKTLQDRESKNVRLDAVPVGIDQLNELTPPPNDVDHRSAFEKQTYLIEGFLVEYKIESDHDIHAVIKSDTGKLIAVEFPHPDCTLAAPGSLAALMLQARNSFLKSFKATGKFKKPRGETRVRVAGVGFFDREHGQKGAENAVELHPVLHFEVVYVHPPKKSVKRGKTRD
jgi:hypothetical protein